MENSQIDTIDKEFKIILPSNFLIDNNIDDNILLLSSDQFKNWRDTIFVNIIKYINDHKLKNTYNKHPSIFWEERIILVYFIYQQLIKGDHINFSFREDHDTNPEHIRLQREYVHALNSALLKIFINYEEKRTIKREKKCWNESYESDSYDSETDTWNYKSCETGPCHITWNMYYICIFPKGKRKSSKVVWAIYMKNNITITKL